MTIKVVAWLMYLLICVYQVIDTMQTVMLLEKGEEEANFILAYLIEQYGYNSIWVFKLFFVGAFGIILFYFFRYRDKVNKAKLCPICREG